MLRFFQPIEDNKKAIEGKEEKENKKAEKHKKLKTSLKAAS